MAVVGGGMAGWSCARRAQELGLSVVVVEKGPEAPGLCNARMSGGMLHAAYLSVREEPDYLAEYAMEITDGLAQPDLVEAWASNCSRALDWLVGQGGALTAESDVPGRLAFLSPLRPPPTGLEAFDRERGPDRTLTLLAQKVQQNGGSFVGSTRALELVLDSTGVVCGVLARCPDGLRFVRAAGVLIADGGFQANPEMLVRYIAPRADEMLLRSMPTGTGDGIRMGLDIGAKAVHMNYFYGHMLSLDAITNPNLWPYPLIDGLIEQGILVNHRGERFVDECVSGTGVTNEVMSGIGVTNAVGKSGNPRAAIVIFDRLTWNAAEKGYLETAPVNPALVELGGTVHVADTLEELATVSGIHTETLVTTVHTFNAAAEAGQTPNLLVPRSGKPRPIKVAPFYALPCVAGLTFTMGGLLVTGHAQVVDVDHKPISGLYAAGGSMGGLQGGPRGGYMGGLIESLVFGLLAAEHLASGARAPRGAGGEETTKGQPPGEPEASLADYRPTSGAKGSTAGLAEEDGEEGGDE